MPARNGKLLPHERPGYTPSRQKPRTYTGPDTPIAYDADWQYFNNLTAEQIAWFKAQPEWGSYVLDVQDAVAQQNAANAVKHNKSPR